MQAAHRCQSSEAGSGDIERCGGGLWIVCRYRQNDWGRALHLVFTKLHF